MLSKAAVKRLIERARYIQSRLEQVKPLYGELDEITLLLIPVKEMLPQYGVTLEDNFKVKNTSFKAVGIRRYELKGLS